MKRFSFLVIMLSFVCNTFFAAGKQVRSDHFESDFKMTSTRGQVASPKVQYGHFVYSAVVGVSVVYDNSIEEEIPKEIQRFIMKFLGSEKIRSCTEYKVLRDGDMVTLYPKKQSVKQYFSQVQVFFNSLTGFIREVEVVVPSGDVTTIELFNVESR